LPKGEALVLNLHRLRLLAELNRRGTVSEVARALSYSPSTISQQLTTLESEVGHELLTRVGRYVHLTRQGRLLVGHAEALLMEAERAEVELRASMDEPRGIVGIACFQTAALALAPDLLTYVQKHWPTLQVHIAEMAPDLAIEALLARDFDMVVGEEYPGRPVQRDAEVVVRELESDSMRLVCSSSGPVPRGLADVADMDWVMEPVGNAARDWAVATCREAGFEPRVRFEFADLLVQARLVETGHAIGLLPDMLWASRQSSVTRVPLQPPRSRKIFTAVRAAGSSDPGLAAIRQALEVIARSYSRSRDRSP
jgi:DNA-binding transcriptional LysR family regulator